MSQPSWIGQTISGRYKIEALLGQGGMSAVYKGTDPNLRRVVAIKLIHPHLSNDPEFVRRFEQEAAAVAQLRHPNIIQVFDFNHDGDVYYMVLEYVPGETLQAKLKALHAAGERLSLHRTLQVMAAVCDAVAYAHQHGMIHRDLKPGNVMLDPQGQPILMDFGVARMLGGQQHTATGAIVGTVAYMSPEQARGERVDERGDIYSLGIMLYEMTTGRPPFEGDSAMTIMMKHLSEPVPDIRKIVSDVPEALVAVITKALAKGPAERFQTAAEMANALRAIESPAPTTGVGAIPTAAQPEPTPRTMVSPPPASPTSVHPPVPAPTARTALPGTPTAPPEAAPTVATLPLSTTPATVAPPTAPAAPARKGGVPVGLWLGLGVAGIAIIVLGLFLLPRLVGEGTATREVESTPTAGAVTAAALTPTPRVESATATLSPPTHTPPPPTAAPTLEPTPIPLPEGMVLVPAGTFQMGSDVGEPDEKPVHAVTLDAFYLDQYEVTNGRYKACVDAGGCAPPGGNRYASPDFADFPVTLITWHQAQAFCQWDQGKRLPTEAEWEYAARGTDGRRFPWGNEFDQQLIPATAQSTIKVGSFEGNVSPFGVYDMAGNAVEWVADWYGRNYYANSPGANPTGPKAGTQKVMRGGSFGNTDGRFYTTTWRYQQSPGFRDVDIGFRCAKNLP